MSWGEIRATGSEDEVFGLDPDDRDESEDLRDFGACRSCEAPGVAIWNGWPWCRRCLAVVAPEARTE